MASFSLKESSELAQIFEIQDLKKRFIVMLPFYIQWAQSERDLYQLPKDESLRFFELTETAYGTKTIGGKVVIVYETSDEELIEALSGVIQNLDVVTRKTHAVFFKKKNLTLEFDRLAYLFAKYVVLKKMREAKAP